MVFSQTYSATGTDKRIRVEIKGAVFVRFGVCKIAAFSPRREVAKC